MTFSSRREPPFAVRNSRENNSSDRDEHGAKTNGAKTNVYLIINTKVVPYIQTGVVDPILMIKQKKTKV